MNFYIKLRIFPLCTEVTHNENNLTQKADPASLLTCSWACSMCGQAHRYTAEGADVAEGYSTRHMRFSADTRAGGNRSCGRAGPAI